VRVVDQHAHGPPIGGLGADQLRQRLRADGLELAPVLVGVGARGHAAVVEAVGDGCHPEGLPGRRGGGEHVPRGDERGAEAVVGEAAAELEQRVRVALRARAGQEQHVCAAAPAGSRGGRRGGAGGARAPHCLLSSLALCCVRTSQ